MEININYNSYKLRDKEISCSGTLAQVKPSWCNNKEVIIKKWPYSRKHIYFNEKKIYLKLQGEDYIPNILYYDDKHLTIIVEDAGDSLRKLVRNNEYHKIPKNLHFKLDFIIKKLYNKYKLIHGDITFRNICVKNNKLYLIDFDATRTINVDSFDYTSMANGGLYKEVSLLTNYKFFCYYINLELNNKQP